MCKYLAPTTHTRNVSLFSHSCPLCNLQSLLNSPYNLALAVSLHDVYIYSYYIAFI